MSKDKISDYSATANSNTDIGGINIDEGCAPSGINDAIRTLMKQLKDWQSGSQDVYIHPAGSASVPSITATGDTNTGLFFPAADTVGITTGGTERARVDSSGNFGLGVTPSAWYSTWKAMDVGNGAVATAGTPDFRLYSNSYKNTSAVDTYKGSGQASYYIQNNGAHSWATAPSGTAGNPVTFTQVLGVDKDKTLFLQGGTQSSGTGIAFPATQSASSDANTLDDYEEGIWTPVIAGSSGGSATYNNQNGTYTKIGNVVVLNFWIYGSSKNTVAGTIYISGLPFFSGSTSSRPSTFFRTNNWSITGSLDGWITNSDNKIAVDIVNNGSSSSANATNIGAGNFEVGGSITYIIA